MPILILVLVVLWLWAEIAAFIAIADGMGVLLSLLGVFATAFVGMWLLRSQGRIVMASLQAQLAKGEPPLASMASGVSMAVGAVLMLVPGYLSDAVGFLLFLPVLRSVAGAVILGFLAARRASFARYGMRFSAGPGRAGGTRGASGRDGSSGEDNVIDGDFTERPDPARSLDEK